MRRDIARTCGRETLGNSKFSLQRSVVISIQVFRMSYWPARLSPRADIFGTGSLPCQVYPSGGSIMRCIFYVSCVAGPAALLSSRKGEEGSNDRLKLKQHRDGTREHVESPPPDSFHGHFCAIEHPPPTPSSPLSPDLFFSLPRATICVKSKPFRFMIGLAGRIDSAAGLKNRFPCIIAQQRCLKAASPENRP